MTPKKFFKILLILLAGIIFSVFVFQYFLLFQEKYHEQRHSYSTQPFLLDDTTQYSFEINGKTKDERLLNSQKLLYLWLEFDYPPTDNHHSLKISPFSMIVSVTGKSQFSNVKDTNSYNRLVFNFDAPSDTFRLWHAQEFFWQKGLEKTNTAVLLGVVVNDRYENLDIRIKILTPDSTLNKYQPRLSLSTQGIYDSFILGYIISRFIFGFLAFVFYLILIFIIVKEFRKAKLIQIDSEAKNNGS